MQHVERSIIRLFSPAFLLLALTFSCQDNIISVYKWVGVPVLGFQIFHSSTKEYPLPERLGHHALPHRRPLRRRRRNLDIRRKLQHHFVPPSSDSVKDRCFFICAVQLGRNYDCIVEKGEQVFFLVQFLC